MDSTRYQVISCKTGIPPSTVNSVLEKGSPRPAPFTADTEQSHTECRGLSEMGCMRTKSWVHIPCGFLPSSVTVKDNIVVLYIVTELPIS